MSAFDVLIKIKPRKNACLPRHETDDYNKLVIYMEYGPVPEYELVEC